jgi:hypothetical protein
MALKGTLKDFGITEILQLIGQQQKSGTLLIKAKAHDVQVGFKEGSIVKAETSTRRKQDLIGSMLVRAGLITEDQLREALETQKTTLMRLGDVLIQSGAIAEARFKELVRLQATETLYKLFQLQAGTYEFVQGEVEYDPQMMTPLRAEGVLMDGFRMVDEWPMLKKKLPPFSATFETLKALPPDTGRHEEDNLDDAFGAPEEKKAESKGEFQSIGSHERKVYGLIGPGMDVQRLIDRSCLGEFETCKALVNLLNLGYARPLSASISASADRVPFMDRARQFVSLVVIPIVVLGGLHWVGSNVRFSPVDTQSPSRFADPAVQRFIGEQQLSRLETAVDLYRLERGELPKSLDSLVEAGLLTRTDLTYPWKEHYHYRALSQGQFVLLPPLR